MSTKRVLWIVLFVLPLLLGQMCGAPPEEPEEIVEPAADPSSMPPFGVDNPVEEPEIIPPIDFQPVEEDPPEVVNPPGDHPEMPQDPVDPPDEPDEPPPVLVSVIDSVNNPTLKTKRFLTAEEIGYVWFFLCTGVISPPKEDYRVPDGTRLWLDPEFGLYSFHDIFCRFELDESSGDVSTALLNLYCLENSSTADSPAPDIWISRVLKNWSVEAFSRDPWQVYCAPDWGFSDTIDGYTPPTPSIGQWYSMDISEAFQKWASGEWANYGLRLEVDGWYDEFTSFASAEYLDEGLRPWLLLYHGPALELKLPLPGGKEGEKKAWILTQESGVGTHTGNLFYSLDFSYSSATVGADGKVVVTNEIADGKKVVVCASAAGVVREAGLKNGNGYYVVIDHEPAGYDTCYLHMEKDSLMVKVGDCVAQGTPLGFMGKTGNSTGVHVHMGVRYKGRGDKDVPQLAKVTLEGRPFLGFNVGKGNNYYQSTNLP